MDLSTMTGLLDQSLLLNYSYRNMYVNNLLSSNGISSSSNKTFKAELEREKESPTRELVQITSGGDSFVNETKESSESFKKATESLTNSSKLKVTAENATGTVSSGAEAQDYTLAVQQLATTQVNSGAVLGTYGKDFTVGENTIEITAGGKTQTVTFNITESDNNKDSLSKMINAINKSGLDITASASNTGSSATTGLVIKSKNTGTDSEFSIKDVTGNAVAVTNADRVTQAASNAIYSVDGELAVSQSNNISLQNGKVNLTLTKADGKDYSLKVEYDSNKMLDSINTFVEQYNNMMASSNANSGNSAVARGLETRLRTYAAENFNALKEVGITYKSGVMTVNEDALKNAIANKSDKVNDLFGSNGKLVVNANMEATSLNSLAKSSHSTTTYAYQYNNTPYTSQNAYSNIYGLLN